MFPPLQLFFWLLLTSATVSASSTVPPPLKRITHPSSLAIEVIPRQLSSSNHVLRSSPSVDPGILLHSDSFRLILSAFDETFHLHLRPNDDLIHPAARIHYYSSTSSGQTILTRTEPLRRESVKAYYGEVVPGHLSALKLKHDAARVVPDSRYQLGWARIMVLDQGDVSAGIPPAFEGAFTVNGITYHVTTTDNYLRNKHHLDPDVAISVDHPDAGLVIWRDSDVLPPHEEAALRLKHGLSPVPSRIVRPGTCAHDSVDYNTDPAENPALRKPLTTPWYDPFNILDAYPISPNKTKRTDVAGNDMSSNFLDYIGQTAGCPSTQKVLYMGVAADCTYTQRYGNQSNATQQILTDWNSASALYRSTFNVSLGIVELQVFDSTCPTTADPAVPWNIGCGDVTLNDRLSSFSQWRGNKGNDGTGLWHLLSQCVTGTEVGIAWLATLCQITSSGSAPDVVSGTAVSTAGLTEWQVVAHEVGHNFGAIHDCTDGCTLSSSCCPSSSTTCNANSQFIMSPTASDTESQFSPCSVGNVCSLMQGLSGGQTNTTCLLDPDPSRQVFSLQMCGNGIVEAGEQCDPGSGVESACCDPTTCMFRTGAVCDPDSSGCCTAGCQFASATQVCRAARSATCDTAEYCTGNSSACPADITTPNGQSCGSNGLACANGLCTSLNQQCQTAGASLNLTTACSESDSSCQVSCQDPTTPNQCVVLQTLLIDGSPCGYGGTCSSGTCEAGSWWDTFTAWYRQNLQIGIPVSIVAGIIFLLFLWFMFLCIRRCVTRRRLKTRNSRIRSGEPALTNARAERISSWTGVGGSVPVAFPTRAVSQSRGFHNVAPPNPSVYRPSRTQQDPRWVDERLYNG